MIDWWLLRSAGVPSYTEVTQVSRRRSDVMQKVGCHTQKVVEAVEFSSPIGEYGVEGVLHVGPSGLMAPIIPDGVIILVMIFVIILVVILE